MVYVTNIKLCLRVNNYSYKKCFERDLLVKWLREGVFTIIALYRISGSSYRE